MADNRIFWSVVRADSGLFYAKLIEDYGSNERYVRRLSPAFVSAEQAWKYATDADATAEYDDDLKLRVRDRQVGSGMKHRP